ncbi:MAG: GAF domain-containing protein, partial [Magnetococcales bacterium]|nr:GAF domain-containing protein [Magnetococcales bacterium]
MSFNNSFTQGQTNAPSQHEQFSGLPEGHPPIGRFLSVPVINRGRLVAQIAVANGR